MREAGMGCWIQSYVASNSEYLHEWNIASFIVELYNGDSLSNQIQEVWQEQT